MCYVSQDPTTIILSSTLPRLTARLNIRLDGLQYESSLAFSQHT